jgi:hypothetical protein
MEKRMLWLGLMLMVVGLCSSGALAATLGPPAAGLDAGQFRVGLDISSSQTGIDLDGESTAKFTAVLDKHSETEIGDLDEFQDNDAIQSETMFANLGYGIVDKLEVYLLLGVSDLGFGDETDFHDLDRDFGNSDDLAYGFGVKGTIFEEENLKFGALFQMTWASFDGDLGLDNVRVENEDVGYGDGAPNFDDVPGTYEIDYYQMKIAVGPTYKLTETISIYGGPFYQLMNGTLDEERSRVFKDVGPEEGPVYDKVTVYEDASVDITERSRYGVYFGAQINCRENLPLCVECQTSNETYVVGASLAYKF